MTLAEALAPEKAKPVQHEWRGQEADFAFLSKALPREAYFTAIDGGRAKNRILGNMRKKRGIRSGLPDWLIVWSGITLWIERKVSAAESDLSDNQRVTAERLQENGHKWARANSTDEVEAACRAAGIPLRATLGGIRTRIEEQDARLPAKPKRKSRRPKSDGSISVARAHQMGFWRPSR